LKNIDLHFPIKLTINVQQYTIWHVQMYVHSSHAQNFYSVFYDVANKKRHFHLCTKAGWGMPRSLEPNTSNVLVTTTKIKAKLKTGPNTVVFVHFSCLFLGIQQLWKESHFLFENVYYFVTFAKSISITNPKKLESSIKCCIFGEIDAKMTKKSSSTTRVNQRQFFPKLARSRRRFPLSLIFNEILQHFNND
jgi:hypothetical protein